jgi:hypothetical protein
MQSKEAVDDAYLPALHNVHDVVPDVGAYVPLAQATHEEDAVAPMVVEYLPLGQDTHDDKSAISV